MNIIALLQLLKNTEGGAEIVKQAFDFAIKMSTYRRFFDRVVIRSVNPVDIAKMGYGHTIIFVGMLYEAAMQLPSVFFDLGNKDIVGLLGGFSIKSKEFEIFRNKSKQKIFDVNFLKLTECLCKLKSKGSLSEEEGVDFSRKALKIYAPTANQLGMHKLKDELEVLAFSFLYPKESAELEKFVFEYYENSDEVINGIKYKLKKELFDNGIKSITMQGRRKNLYRIYKKLLSHNKEMLSIHDIIALRIIVEDKKDCYTVMRIIHKLWKEAKNRQKDYIVNPKANGYKSLHTTVYIGAQTVEFQIRTKKMDEEAEYGVAAHWFYKENGSHPPMGNLEMFKKINELHRKFR